jgi:uncharacterized phage protein (TIGR01671 family)
MREIKFRAWDSYNKRWIHNLLYRIDGQGGELDESYSLVQFTGLKDKNGVEIYEGDELHCFYNNGGDEKDRNGVVKYKAPMFYVEMKIGKEMHDFDFNYFNTIEVIGNVMENKELLDESK